MRRLLTGSWSLRPRVSISCLNTDKQLRYKPKLIHYFSPLTFSYMRLGCCNRRDARATYDLMVHFDPKYEWKND